MDLTGDRLAGIVELFGALDRGELRRAVEELAFREGTEIDDSTVADAIDGAIADFRLVEIEDRLVAGPTAFPEVPPGGEDLPHMLDWEDRDIDPATVAHAVEERFRREAAGAVADGDDEAISRLIDLSYDIEATLAIDLGEARDQLETAETATE